MTATNLTMPGHPRYQPKHLQPDFGYDMLMRPVAEVEIASMQVLGEISIIPEADIKLLTPDVIEKILSISTTEVDVRERTKTKHDVRAWVELAQEILPPALRRWCHNFLTSSDPLDTARILQFLRVYESVLEPSIDCVIADFAQLTRNFSGQLQIGRTHGQHALPITVGFWFATILNRVMYNFQAMDRAASGLVGKVSGAVGAYNAQVGLGIAEKCGEKSFEARVLEKLGLRPAPISTQILPPEPLAYFLHACVMLSAVFGQFGDDVRHLMRSEIGEVHEAKEPGDVGSSTMAHKINPKDCENLKAMYVKNQAEFLKVILTLNSEHQRDLTGSAVARDFPIIVINLTTQLNTLLREDKEGKRFLSKISVDPAACQRNFDQNKNVILAEPIYIALQMAGYDGNAHKLVNDRAVPLARRENIPLIDAVSQLARDDEQLFAALSSIPADVARLFRNPESYTGHAQKKALEVAAFADEFLHG